ncbi:MAG: alpha/beta hydrolase, partial [Crocinitomicaceae bacterium]|nr:alpha/beta hydrolase [Crocinitomicaceae bacterium]
KLSESDGAFGPIPLEDHKIDGKIIEFSWAAIGLSFEGVYSDKESNIKGKMFHNGIEWDVVFTKERPKNAILIRPQEPKGPFDYTIEKIKIKNGKYVLGATLTLPKEFSESSSIVVLASGSGPQNRDCEIMGHKPFWVIADHLAKNGIACLRFDDRGVGESTGYFVGSGLSDFASDVVSCVKYLRKTKKYKENKIGLTGHSEGGMHTLIAATSYKKVDFIMQLSSVGTNGGEVLIEQQYLIPIKSGAPEVNARWNQSVFAGSVEIIKENKQEKAVPLLTEFLEKKYEEAPQEYKDKMKKQAFIDATIGFINNDWARDFVNFDTQDYLEKLKIPLFAATGSEDIQVPSVSNLAGFKAYRGASSQTSSMGGLNHLMQTCETCGIDEYGSIEETFSMGLMDMMVKWIGGLE